MRNANTPRVREILESFYGAKLLEFQEQSNMWYFKFFQFTVVGEMKPQIIVPPFLCRFGTVSIGQRVIEFNTFLKFSDYMEFENYFTQNPEELLYAKPKT